MTIKQIIEKLASVLCDPDGSVSIRGSAEDCKIVQDALAALRELRPATNQEAQEGAGPEADYDLESYMAGVRWSERSFFGDET